MSWLQSVTLLSLQSATWKPITGLLGFLLSDTYFIFTTKRSTQDSIHWINELTKFENAWSLIIDLSICEPLHVRFRTVLQTSIGYHATSEKCQNRKSPLHSMTSSARASSVGGMDRPSALAVFKLIARSNLVGNWIGKSLGLAPLSMRSTYPAPS
jgi:hypothetical protein